MLVLAMEFSRDERAEVSAEARDPERVSLPQNGTEVGPAPVVAVSGGRNLRP